MSEELGELNPSFNITLSLGILKYHVYVCTELTRVVIWHIRISLALSVEFPHSSGYPKNKHRTNTIPIPIHLISESFLELEYHFKWLLKKQNWWWWAVSYFDRFWPDDFPETSEVPTHWGTLGFLKQYLHIKWLLHKLNWLVLNYLTLLWFSTWWWTEICSFQQRKKLCWEMSLCSMQHC